MTRELLERLKSEDFAVAIGFLVPSAALRGRLSATPEVQAVRQGVIEGRVSEENLRGFVASEMAELQRGERHPHDLALAALAVALEGIAAPFAKEYLHDLAEVELAELSTSIRVARECLRQSGFSSKAAQDEPSASAAR